MSMCVYVCVVLIANTVPSPTASCFIAVRIPSCKQKRHKEKGINHPSTGRKSFLKIVFQALPFEECSLIKHSADGRKSLPKD